MSFLRTSKQPSQNRNNRDIMSHWGWAVPILLIVAALSIRQIDLYPPTLDEFYSMNNAGWLVNSPYSPIDIIQSLQKNSPNHTPGYFMLLSLSIGQSHHIRCCPGTSFDDFHRCLLSLAISTTYDFVLGRVLTICTGLLSLAMVYRLAIQILSRQPQVCLRSSLSPVMPSTISIMLMFVCIPCLFSLPALCCGSIASYISRATHHISAEPGQTKRLPRVRCRCLWSGQYTCL